MTTQKFLSRMVGWQAKRNLRIAGVIGFIALAASMGWLFILAAHWSRQNQMMRTYILTHFLYDLLVGGALWYSTVMLVRVLKWLARLPSPERQAELERETRKRAEMLRASPDRRCDPAEELEAADLLEEVAAFIHQVNASYAARDEEAARTATSPNG